MKDGPLVRPQDGKIIGGVCAALAQRFEMDVTLMRVLWVVALCCFGVGLVTYLILWLVIPAEK
jgi:phage shock protein PspC (stress-responsive transcriptional regulator)